MKMIFASLFIFTFSVFGATPGKSAPQFTLADSMGKQRSLSDFKGQYVVLEWLNHGCPFVRKHYDSGNMQKLQKEVQNLENKYPSKPKVAWLSVISSTEGKQGFSSPEQANQDKKEYHANPTAILLDKNGSVGKEYGAKTTPHVFLISPDQKVIYQGAIDDKPSTDVEDIPKAKNYLMTALNESLSGKKVSVAETKPYGCSVKY